MQCFTTALTLIYFAARCLCRPALGTWTCCRLHQQEEAMYIYDLTDRKNSRTQHPIWATAKIISVVQCRRNGALAVLTTSLSSNVIIAQKSSQNTVPEQTMRLNMSYEFVIVQQHGSPHVSNSQQTTVCKICHPRVSKRQSAKFVSPANTYRACSQSS